MRAPTLAPSPFGIHRGRTRRLVYTVFTFGVLLFTYGVAVTVIGPVPVDPGLIAMGGTAVMAVGILLACLMALVAAGFVRQEEPRPLSSRAVLAIGLVAPVLSAVVLVAATSVRPGAVARQPAFLAWVLPGLLAIGLQLFVGSLEPASRRRRLFAATAVAVFALVVAAQIAADGMLSLGPVEASAAVRTVEASIAIGGVAAVVFLLVGGPLYLLGNVLVCRPDYHRIR